MSREPNRPGSFRLGTVIVALALPVLTLSASAQQGHPPPHHHDFSDAGKWASRFDDPARDEWQLPDRVIAALELPADARVADLGAGTGYFAVRLARAVPSGRVWGVDLEPDMVRHLNQRARTEGFANLFSTLAIPGDPLLPEPVDLVLVVNTYHHIADRPVYFERLRAHLRPGGRVAVVDFRKGDLPFGPPDSMKLAPAEVEREMTAAGYVVTARHDVLPHQYFLVFGVGTGS